MKTFATSALFAALTLTAFASNQAGAMTVADLNAAPGKTASGVAKASFVFGDELLPGRNLGLNRIDAEAAKAAAEAYYDFDALISFGAMILAGAALFAVVAAFNRRAEVKPAQQREGEDWRNTVLRGLEQDLARFTGGLRRAA